MNSTFDYFKYPEVHYPDKLNTYVLNESDILYEFMISNFKSLKKPIKPKIPPKPKEPYKNNLSTVHKIVFSLIVSIILGYIAYHISFLIYDYTKLNNDNKNLGGVTFFISFLGLIILVYNQDENKKKAIENYNLLLQEYFNELEDYNLLFIKYEEEKKKYENLCLTARKILKSKNEDAKKLVDKIKMKYIKNGNLIYPSNLTIGYKNVNIGKSEIKFKIWLTKFFNDQILTDRTFEIFNNGRAYVPDFILMHNKTNLIIDIEIDEPYYGNIPTHYISDVNDELRNSYFINNDIVVIRFSEEQVNNCPESCCKFIASIIYKLTGDNLVYSSLSTVDDLYEHIKWTKKDSELLIKKRFREIPNGRCELFIGTLEDMRDSYYDSFLP